MKRNGRALNPTRTRDPATVREIRVRDAVKAKSLVELRTLESGSSFTFPTSNHCLGRPPNGMRISCKLQAWRLHNPLFR
jgi:hypothetical protein